MHSRTTTAADTVDDRTAPSRWTSITLPPGTNPALACNSQLQGWLDVNGSSVTVTLHVIGSTPDETTGVVYEVEPRFERPSFRLEAVPAKTHLRVASDGTAEIGILPEIEPGTATYEVQSWASGRATGDSVRPTSAVIMVDGLPLTVALVQHEFIPTANPVGDSVGVNVWKIVVARSDHPADALLPRCCELREDPAGRFFLTWTITPA